MALDHAFISFKKIAQQYAQQTSKQNHNFILKRKKKLNINNKCKEWNHNPSSTRPWMVFLVFNIIFFRSHIIINLEPFLSFLNIVILFFFFYFSFFIWACLYRTYYLRYKKRKREYFRWSKAKKKNTGHKYMWAGVLLTKSDRCYLLICDGIGCKR